MKYKNVTIHRILKKKRKKKGEIEETRQEIQTNIDKEAEKLFEKKKTTKQRNKLYSINETNRKNEKGRKKKT